MNVAYDQFSTNDVAKILGTSPQTVTSWLRKGYIEATNVSDGVEKARYMFDDEEVTKVQNLIKHYGGFSWMNHVEKKTVAKPIALPVTQIIAPMVEQPKPENTFSADKVMNKILKIQDLKEELEDIEARRNQLMAEIETLRNEVMEEI